MRRRFSPARPVRGLLQAVDRWRSTHSLKWRVALGALAALFTGMGLIACDMGEQAEAQLVARAEAREQLVARQLAAVVGHRVAQLQRALRVSAAGLEPRTLKDDARLADFIAARPVLRTLFANVFVADADGQVRVMLDERGTRAPVFSIRDREYFRRALSSAQAVVSEPLSGRVSNEPVVTFVQPILASGRVWGVLGGTLRLASRDLIDDLAEIADYDDTSMVVISDDAGRILAHPQQARLMSELSAEPRLAEAAARWRREGRPLIREAGAWSSSASVVGMASDPHALWRVWRLTSRESLLAPMRQARVQAMRKAAWIAAGLAGVLLAFLAWQLRPLTVLENRARQLLHGDDTDDWPVGSDEIGRLAATLRHVWAERAQIDRFNRHIMQKLSSVMGASPIGLMFVRQQRFELVSAEGCRLLGTDEATLLGRDVETIFPRAGDFATAREAAGRAFDRGGQYEGEWQLRKADGTLFWARIRARPVDAADRESGSIWSLYNIDEQVFSRQRLEHDAAHDALTGVLNRKGFMGRMSQALSCAQGGQSAALIAIDLDRFKPVNDLGGHAAGDTLLQQVAQAIVQSVRGSDAVGRLGGDEFAVLLPACDQAHATAIAEKVLCAIGEAGITVNGNRLQVGASFGVAIATSARQDIAAWLAAADAACYDAKRAGRNAIRIASNGSWAQPRTDSESATAA